MLRTTTFKLTSFLVLIMTFGITAYAQVPDSLNYQGYLTDSSGQPQIDPLVIQFSFYNVETGGVPLWTDNQDVFPIQGLFSTTFGDITNPFPVGMFDTPLFLGVKVSADPEMTPRIALTSAAFSHKAKDAQTVGGFAPAQLDQSGDVATLTGSLSATQGDVSLIQLDVTAVESDLALLQSGVADNQNDISQLQSDLANTSSDLTIVENTLPTLQSLVSQGCTSGSSIRQIFSGGTVTCEVDDAGPWSEFNGNAYVNGGARVGVGTTAPAASIQIDSPVDVDPFRARVGSSTKLRVHTNGSVSVGTSSAGPENGLYVAGYAGFGTTTPLARLTSTDPNWQMQINNNDVGGDDWYLGSSANAWAAGAGKFMISPTGSSTNAALTINAQKNVGIGTTAPATRLHIGGGSDVNPVSGGYLTLGLSTGSNIAIDSNEIMGRNNGAASILALNAEGGEVTINSGGSRDNDSLKIVGRVNFDNGGNSGLRISATNSNPTNALFEPTLYEEGLVGSSTRPFWRIYSREFYASSPIEYRTYSDRSVKKDIAPIAGALNTIKALEGVSYALIKHPMNTNNRQLSAEEQFVNDHQLGFIAQDVEQILPQLVSEDQDSGLKTVAYMGVIPVLVEALKEQQAQLDAQRAELEALKKRLN